MLADNFLPFPAYNNNNSISPINEKALLYEQWFVGLLQSIPLEKVILGFLENACSSEVESSH